MAVLQVFVKIRDLVTKPLQNIGTKINKFGTTVKRSFESLGKFRNLLFGFGALRVGKFFFDAATSIEVFSNQLKIVTGSAEAAADALGTIRELARTSPLETEDVVQAYVRLRAVGIDPTIAQFKTLGGVAVLMNRDVSDILQAFIGLNKRTLRELGVEIDRTGSKAIIQSGDIRRVVQKDSASIRGALLEVWEERFPNAIETAANTTKAQIAVMKSEWFEFAADLGKEFIPLFNGIISLIAKMGSKLREIYTDYLTWVEMAFDITDDKLQAQIRNNSTIVLQLEDEISALQRKIELAEEAGTTTILWVDRAGRIRKESIAIVKAEIEVMKGQMAATVGEIKGAKSELDKFFESLDKNKAKLQLGAGALGAGAAREKGKDDPISAFRRSMKDLGPQSEELKNFDHWQKSLTDSWNKEAQKRQEIAKREADAIAAFSHSLGVAIASGFGKGMEGLKESFKQSLIVTLGFIERKIILQRVAALADAMAMGPLAPVALLKAGAQIAAISALFAGARAAVNSFASGTQFAPGGMARVHKDETVFLPRGSQVIPAAARGPGQSTVTIAPVFQGPVDRETAPQIINKLDELGDLITRASRQGYINWNDVMATTS